MVCEAGTITGTRCDSLGARFSVSWVPPEDREAMRRLGSSQGLTDHLMVCSRCYEALRGRKAEIQAGHLTLRGVLVHVQRERGQHGRA